MNLRTPNSDRAIHYRIGFSRSARDPAEFASIVVIHVEQFGGATSDQSQSDYPVAFHGEMFAPFMRTRMKQGDELTVHVRGQIRSLVKVAPMARERKIGLVVRAAMLPGDDVFDVESDERQFVLMASAVFTAVPRAVTDEAAERSINRHTLTRSVGGNHGAGLGLQHADEVDRTDPRFIFRPLGGRQRPLGRLLREFLHFSLNLRRGPQSRDATRHVRRETTADGIKQFIEDHGWGKITHDDRLP